jgi:S1-C subfamily serine protease
MQSNPNLFGLPQTALRSVLVAACLLICGASLAAEQEFIGQPLSVGTHPQSLPSIPKEPDWQMITLDGLSASRISQVLEATLDEEAFRTRGPREVGLYKKISPSVVRVYTTDREGSGSYIGSNLILTNWHVVQGSNEVGVLFKSPQEGVEANPAAMVRAAVIRADLVRDLALLRVASVPPNVRPLELGSAAEIQVGADVSAIGHPNNEPWTYTKGMISQIRRDFSWEAEGYSHRATVIQTQTPINPGNSGGPLLGDSGKLLGVNSFKDPDAENLNFAVSVEDVSAFLKSPSKGAVPRQASKQSCASRQLYEGRDQGNTGGQVDFDTNCDGKADRLLFIPDDKSKPISALIDSNFDGRTDIEVDDINRDGKWDISFYDTNFDGTFDLKGYHPDGGLAASRYEKYAAR